ncbi:MAG: hypothetical protein J5935_01465 [Lachnospiraceae bacterium]|nr:hypothetical protein [Lachnospiraceae bacterium]
MKRNWKALLSVMLIMMLALTACASTPSQTPQEAPAESAGEAAAESTEAEEAAAEEAATEETAEEAPAGVLQNKLFSIELPEDVLDIYDAEITDESIRIYHKASRENYGGFAFGFSAFEDPGDYFGGMTPKIGEVTGADGKLYDLVSERPSDVQYDFENKEAEEEYRKLYDIFGDVSETLTGVEGATVALGAGTKGEDLYAEQLAKHRQSIEEGWDASKLEEEDMSPMYAVIAASTENPMDHIGYAYRDSNYDGIDELFVGEITEGEWKGIVYDVYTIADRKPVHAMSGTDRARLYALESADLCCEYSGGAGLSGYRYISIEPGTGEVVQSVDFKIDTYEDPDAPWFVSYSFDPENPEWEALSEEDWEQRRSNFGEYERFDYTPLSE